MKQQQDEKKYDAMLNEGGEGYNPYRYPTEPVQEDLDDKAYRLRTKLGYIPLGAEYDQIEAELNSVLQQIAGGAK